MLVVNTKFVEEHATFTVILGDRIIPPPTRFVYIVNVISITGVVEE